MKRKLNTRIIPITNKIRRNPLLLFVTIASKVYAYNYIYFIFGIVKFELFVVSAVFLFFLSLEEFSHIAVALGRKVVEDTDEPQLVVKYVSFSGIPLVCIQVNIDVKSHKLSPVDLLCLYAGGPMFCLSFIVFGLSLMILLSTPAFYIYTMCFSLLVPIISLIPIPFKRFLRTDGYRIMRISRKYNAKFLTVIYYMFRSVVYVLHYIVFPKKCSVKEYTNPLLNSNLNHELVRLCDECEYQKLLDVYGELRRHSLQTGLIENNIKWLKNKMAGD